MKFSLTVSVFLLCSSFFLAQGQEVVVNKSSNTPDTAVFINMKSTHTDSLTEYEIYRSLAHRRLNGYEQKIDEFAQRLSKENDKVRAKNQPSLIRLEKINASLRVRIESYKPERSWASLDKTEDVDLKNWITAALPGLRSHLELLRANEVGLN